MSLQPDKTTRRLFHSERAMSFLNQPPPPRGAWIPLLASYPTPLFFVPSFYAPLVPHSSSAAQEGDTCPSDTPCLGSAVTWLENFSCWLVRRSVGSHILCVMEESRHQRVGSFPWTLFGVSVAAALQDDGLRRLPRDLDCAEVFCGVGSVWRAAERAGKRAEGYDRNRVPGVTDCSDNVACEDILTHAGFRTALKLVFRLKVGALLWLAPMCNSFCFLALSLTRRAAANDFVGDETKGTVQRGNASAKAAAFLMTVAWARMVHVVLENPLSSRIFNFMTAAGAVVFKATLVRCARCAFSDAADGNRYLKRYRFLSSETWIQQLNKQCVCQRPKKHAPLFTVTYSRGRRRHTGITTALKASAVYPRALGEAVVRAWLRPADVDMPMQSKRVPLRQRRHVAIRKQARFGALACPPGAAAMRKWARPRVQAGPRRDDPPERRVLQESSPDCFEEEGEPDIDACLCSESNSPGLFD